MPDIIEVTVSSSQINTEVTPQAQIEVVEYPVQVIEVASISTGGGGTAALQAHINAENPHPQYDDLPSLTLLFENGII